VPGARLKFSEQQLCNWKLIDHFRSVLLPHLKSVEPSRTEQDPRRKLTAESYFSLFLFGLLNPIITSMRGLCAASQFQRMREVSAHPVAAGSFSEAQHLFDPQILAVVVRELAEQARGQSAFGEPQIRAAVEALTLVDGTVFRAVQRMAWAPAAGFGSAIRLHLHFAAFDQVPIDWSITPGNVCERHELKKKKLRKGSFVVADRLYSEDHLYLKQLQKGGVDFVLRLLGNVTRQPVGPARALSAEDRQAGVVSDRLEELGCLGGGPVLRIIEIHAAGKVFLLATTRQDLPAHLIGLIYRYRWQIELFFQWLKTTLPCGHWLAESPAGVAMQIYSLLIAALLLMLWTGRRPNKRQMEALRFYWMGFADEAELLQVLAAQKNK
jgi:Transposase DDE domain